MSVLYPCPICTHHFSIFLKETSATLHWAFSQPVNGSRLKFGYWYLLLPRTVELEGKYHSFFYPLRQLWAPVMQMDWGHHNSWVSCSIIKMYWFTSSQSHFFSFLYQCFQVLGSSSTETTFTQILISESKARETQTKWESDLTVVLGSRL